MLAACLVVAWLAAPRARPVAAVQAEKGLVVTADLQAGTIVVSRTGSTTPILTHNARADQRPYVHPIVAPDGKGVLTEFSPSHHKHQTGLYWGFTRVNGRDFFHNPHGQFWRRVAATVTHAAGEEVRWQTVYDLLDEAGQPMLTETQRWSMREDNGSYVLDLDWRGEARTNVTIGTYDYGGLFLRMPWQPGMTGEVVNAARQRNARAEGQRSTWIDVGLQVPGRDDLAHVAIFDHPQNPGYPQAWRVDSQMGVGSARTRAADWTIAKDESRDRPSPVPHLHRPARRGGDDAGVDQLQRRRHHGDVATGAERGENREVPHAGGGGRRDDDDGRLCRQRLRR